MLKVKTKAKCHQGVTYLELLVVLSLMATLGFVGLPAMDLMLQKNKLNTMLQQYESALAMAKVMALNAGQYVVFCPMSGSNNCSGNWQDAKLLFVDGNNNGSLEQQEKVILRLEPSSLVASNRKQIRFSPINLADNTTASIRFCSSQYQQLNRAIVISNVGRIRVEKDANKVKC